MARMDNIDIILEEDTGRIFIGKQNKDGSVHKSVRKEITEEALVTVANWFLLKRMNNVTFNNTNNDFPIRMYLVRNQDLNNKIARLLGITDKEKDIDELLR